MGRQRHAIDQLSAFFHPALATSFGLLSVVPLTIGEWLFSASFHRPDPEFELAAKSAECGVVAGSAELGLRSGCHRAEQVRRGATKPSTEKRPPRPRCPTQKERDCSNASVEARQRTGRREAPLASSVALRSPYCLPRIAPAPAGPLCVACLGSSSLSLPLCPRSLHALELRRG